MDLPSPGNLRLSARRIFTCVIVTHTGILTCTRSSRPYGRPSTRCATLFYRSIAGSRGFGIPLIPDHLRRYPARPVSYYALFKWWLLPSQHPGCLSSSTSLCTEHGFGTLAGGLGCFPFDREDYPSRTHSRDSLCGIRSLVGACRRVAPRLLSVALPLACNSRGCPKRHFEENQISPRLIRLSLLPTSHARTFQRSRLRAFCPFYGAFTLLMGRSRGFGPNACDLTPS